MINLLTRIEENKLASDFGVLGFIPTMTGEGMQLATHLRLMNYNWFTGHLSDFGIVFQTSAFMYQVTSGLNKYLRIAASLIPPVVATIHEYRPLFNAENVTDNMDTALFWLGWTASIGGIKYFGSRRVKEWEKFAKPI